MTLTNFNLLLKEMSYECWKCFSKICKENHDFLDKMYWVSKFVVWFFWKLNPGVLRKLESTNFENLWSGMRCWIKINAYTVYNTVCHREWAISVHIGKSLYRYSTYILIASLIILESSKRHIFRTNHPIFIFEVSFVLASTISPMTRKNEFRSHFI